MSSSVAWTVSIGNTPTITAGTWAGVHALTYTLYRDGVRDPIAHDLTLAQANAYVTANGGIGLNDLGAQLKWAEIPDGATSRQVMTNTVSMSLTEGSPTMVLSPSGLVVTAGRYSDWTDTSGNTHSWTQPTSTARLLLGNQLNGRNAGNFDGKFAVLQALSSIAISDLFTATSAWGFCAFNMNAGNTEVVTSGTFYDANGKWGSSGGYGVLGAAVVGGVQSVLFGCYGAAGAAAIVACPNGMHWIEYGRIGTTLYISLDGGAFQTATANGAWSTSHSMFIGFNNNSASKYFHGDQLSHHTFSAQPSAGVLADMRAYYAYLVGAATVNTALVTRNGDNGQTSTTLLGDCEAGTTNTYALIQASHAFAAWDITVPIGGSTAEVWMSERGTCDPEQHAGAMWRGTTNAPFGATLLGRLTPSGVSGAFVKTTITLPAGSYRVFTQSSPRAANTQNLLVAVKFADGVTFTQVTGHQTKERIFNSAGSRKFSDLGYDPTNAGLKTAHLLTLDTATVGTLDKIVFALGVPDWEADDSTGAADNYCTALTAWIADAKTKQPSATILVTTLTPLGAYEGSRNIAYWRSQVIATAVAASVPHQDCAGMFPASDQLIDNIHLDYPAGQRDFHANWAASVVLPSDGRVMVIGHSVSGVGLTAIANFDVANGIAGLCLQDLAA